MATELLQHPQRFLHPGTVGGHHLLWCGALLLGLVGQSRGGIGGRMACLFEGGGVTLTQALTVVLELGHQFRPL